MKAFHHRVSETQRNLFFSLLDFSLWRSLSRAQPRGVSVQNVFSLETPC